METERRLRGSASPGPAGASRAVLAAILAVSVPAPALAVIPGLAPGLAALLPQILLLLLAALALLFSPRAWWRLLVAAARRPARTLAVVLVAVLGAVLVRSAARAFPAPAPGPEIPDGAGAYPIGDRLAARARSVGLGPVASPGRARVVTELDGAGEIGTIAVVADGRALAVAGSGAAIAAIDAGAGRAAWTTALGGRVAGGPIAAGGRAAALVERTAEPRREIVVLAAKDGSIVARRPVSGPGRAEMAIVDGRLVAALPGRVAAFSLASGRELWSAPRPEREAVGVAGDPLRRYFLLDAGALLEGDLAGGPLRELRRFESGTPLRLAVRSGLVHVLAAGAAGRATVFTIDPVLGGEEERSSDASAGLSWSREVERPVGDEIAAAPWGVVLASPRSLDVLDPASGAVVGRAGLPAAAVCPPAVAGSSVFLGLEGGAVMRWSFALGAAAWTAPVGGGEGGRPPRIGCVAVAGDHLLVGAAGRIEAIPPGGGETAAWGQWRGNAGRTGTCDGEYVPLAGKTLWRREVGGDRAGEAGPTGDEEAMPLPGGWLAAFARAGTTRIARLAAGGEVLGELTLDGRPAALVRLDGTWFVAVRASGGDPGAPSGPGEVVAMREGGGPGAALEVAWRIAVPLGPGHPIAAAAGRLVVSTGSGLRALAAADGSAVWESAAVDCAEGPAIAGGRILAAGRGRGAGAPVAAALEPEGGRVEWRRELEGERVAAASESRGTAFVLTGGAGGAVLTALSSADGSRRWARPVGRSAAGPLVIAGDRAIFRDADGALAAVPVAGGDVVRLTLADRPPPAGGRPDAPVAPVAGFGALFLVEGDRIRAVDGETLDPIWEASAPAPVGCLVLAGGKLLAAWPGGAMCLGAE